MKKVIIEEKNVPTTNVENTGNVRYYGFKREPRDVGFITRESFSRGKYVPRSVGCITNANGWTHAEAKTLQECITELIRSGFDVYEFNTEQGLLRFLTENIE